MDGWHCQGHISNVEPVLSEPLTKKTFKSHLSSALNYYWAASKWGICVFICLCCLHRENILVLDIFFEALNYETIEQKKAYEVAGLLGIASFQLYNIDCLHFLSSCICYEYGFISGDIGGQMGLFIGASILTILEIFDYLYEVRHRHLRGHIVCHF